MIKNEKIAVLPTSIINENYRKSVSLFDANIELLIKNNVIEYPRPEAEENPFYKQLVAYIVCCHEDTVFLMQRRSTSSEQRLKNKYTIGVGGHLRLDDLERTLTDWGQRELDEEITFGNVTRIEPILLINDNSTPVSAVHFGIVYRMTLASADISVKSELKSGKLIPWSEAAQLDNLEPWSTLIFDYYKNSP